MPYQLTLSVLAAVSPKAEINVEWCHDTNGFDCLLVTMFVVVSYSAGREQLLRRLLEKNTNTLDPAQIQEIVLKSAGNMHCVSRTCIASTAYDVGPQRPNQMSVSIVHLAVVPDFAAALCDHAGIALQYHRENPGRTN